MSLKCLIDGELWADIDGYDGIYQVSTRGRVRSMDRRELMRGRHPTPYYRFRNGCELKCQINDIGYVQVLLYKDGVGKLCTVHRLVAKAFIPNPNNYPEVNHLNEERADNWVENLEWCTRSQNALHSNKKFRGENSGTSKLTERQVLKIVELLRQTGPLKLGLFEIGCLFGVTNHTIHKIKVGKNWGWLTGLDKEDR